MPTLWGLSGTGIASRTETAILLGTATIEATPDPAIDGTATVDREALAAWAAQIRRTCTRVLLGDAGEDMLRLRDGVTINVDSASPVATATFRLSDERCAFFAAGTIAAGGVLVQIWCRISTDGADADTLVFSGRTEGLSNEDPYVPTATIQCAGDGAEWLDSVGCLALAAFGRYTRAEILREFAEAADIDGARIVGGDGSGTVTLPLDLSGVSVWELIRRFALIEDWYPREEDGSIRLLPAADVVGPVASPIFAFTPANYFSLCEDPAVRPVTRWVLSTVGIPEEFLAGGTVETTPEIVGGTDALGVRWQIETTTTTDNGVTVSQTIEEYRDIAIPGVAPSAVAWRLWRSQETETDWVTVSYEGTAFRTSRLDEQRTTVREWYSPPCQTSDGYAWSDGTRHSDASATFRTVSESVTEYTYEPEPTCILSSKVTRTSGWYSPVVSSGGYAYDDGTAREHVAYVYVATTADPPHALVEETYSEETSDALKAVNSEIVTSGWRVPPGSAAVDELWGLISSSRTRWSTTPGSGLVGEASYEILADGSSQYASKVYAGELPVLARASDAIPQYRTTPLVLTATAEGTAYGTTQRVETAWGAESLSDLERVARRRFRDQLSPRVTILHTALPLLRLYDVVTVTDPARALDEKKGYVSALRLALDPLNGGLRQETTVLFPLPQFDPEAA